MKHSAALPALALVLIAGPAEARWVVNGAFTTGLGEATQVLDHLAGLVALGLWGGQRGSASAWQIPWAALAALLAAGIATNLGLPIPKAGYGLILAVIAAGALVALDIRLPPAAAAPVAAVIGLFHGAMWGGSLLFWIGYAIGALLMLTAGLGLATVLGRGLSGRVVRGCGGVAALVGIIDLVQQF